MYQETFKGITKSNAERQSAFKQKQRESGKQQMTIWIKRSTRSTLKELSSIIDKSEEDLLEELILWAYEKKKVQTPRSVMELQGLGEDIEDISAQEYVNQERNSLNELHNFTGNEKKV